MSMEPSEETAHIISQVATLDSKIHELNKERATLLQRLNHIRSPMISQTPPEVLSRIFWFATRPYFPWYGYYPLCLSDIRALFKIRAVCFHWRCVTQSCPQLWTTLTLVQKSSYTQTHATDYAGLVRHYYQRLGATTMSLYISDLHFFTDTIIDEIVRVIVMDYPSKLGSLRIKRSRGESTWPAIFEYAKGGIEFTQLEELKLEWRRGEERPWGISPFRDSPRLRTLSLDGDGSRQIPLVFPWKQITTLKLSKTNPKYSFQLLVLCPNLVNYQFSYDDDDGDESWVPPQHQITSMQFLQDLTWFVSEKDGDKRQELWAVDPQFFAHFRFPAVRKLHWYAPLPLDAPSVRDLFANMQELEELKIHLPEWDHCINQYLDVFSNLTTLKADIIGEEVEIPRWLRRLTIKPGKDNLFPRLQRLHLNIGDVSPDVLIVMLYSRRNGPVGWSSLEQGPKELALPPYDPASTHWQHHVRLLEFSSEVRQPLDDKYISIDWTWGPHYDAMKTMMLEAREVEGFGKHDGGQSRIFF